MHVHKIVHGDDFDNNDISIFTKLVMHGYNVLNAIWTEIKTYDFFKYFWGSKDSRTFSFFADKHFGTVVVLSNALLDALCAQLRALRGDSDPSFVHQRHMPIHVFDRHVFCSPETQTKRHIFFRFLAVGCFATSSSARSILTSFLIFTASKGWFLKSGAEE